MVKQMSDSLPVGCVLAIVGGFLEANTFICREQVFANCQTGNLVLLGVYAAQGDWKQVLCYLAPVLAFVLGVFSIEYTRRRLREGAAGLHWRQLVLVIEAVGLSGAALVPVGHYNVVATTIIAFVCSLQVDSFRKLNGNAYATTMCTGNLRSALIQLFICRYEKNPQAGEKASHYFRVIGWFIAGAALGSFLTERFQGRAVFFCCGILLAAFFLMFGRTQALLRWYRLQKNGKKGIIKKYKLAYNQPRKKENPYE